MSRLQELLLKEKTNIDYTSVDGIHYKRFGHLVNLLRVIIAVQSSDYNSLPSGTKIQTVFGDSPSALELTALYKKVRDKLKAPKITTTALKTVKKSFYLATFAELFSILPIPSLKASLAATAFSNYKHGELNKAQQSILYKIARTMLQHKDLLEDKDVMELNLILSSYESAHGDFLNQYNDVDADSDSNFLTQIKQMSDMEINETTASLVDSVEQITKKSRQKQLEGTAIAQEIEYGGLNIEEYTDVKLKNAIIDQEVEDKAITVKQQLTQTINTLTTKYGSKQDEKLKKILVHFAADSLKNFALYVPNTLKSANMSFDMNYNTVANSISFMMFDTVQGLTLQRTFKLDETGNLDVVKHDLFELPSEAQKTGLSKAIIADSLALYKNAGAKKIELHANIGMGGYVWLRYGFRPDKSDLPKISQAFVDISNSVTYGLKEGYTNGINSNTAFDALIKHFNNPILTSYLEEIKNNYSAVQTTIMDIETMMGYDPHDSYDRPPLSASLQFNEVIGAVFKNIGTELSKKFNVNPETLHADISITKIDVVVTAPSIKFIIDKNQTTRGKSVISAKLPKSAVSMGGTIKIIIPVKTFLTIPGIIHTAADNKLMDVFPGNPGDMSKGIIMMSGALNWHGSLDLTDDNQYKLAMNYAMAEKKEG